MLNLPAVHINFDSMFWSWLLNTCSFPECVCVCGSTQGVVAMNDEWTQDKNFALLNFKGVEEQTAFKSFEITVVCVNMLLSGEDLSVTMTLHVIGRAL